MRFVIFGVGLGLANLLSNVHSLGHPAKDGVLVVKPGLSMGGGRVEDRGEGGGRGGEGGVRKGVYGQLLLHTRLYLAPPPQ